MNKKIKLQLKRFNKLFIEINCLLCGQFNFTHKDVEMIIAPNTFKRRI